MARIITDYLDQTAESFEDKAAFVDEKGSITFGQMRRNALHLASAMIEAGYFRKPAAVYLDKSVECIWTYQGVAYSGNFYSPLDTKMPLPRIEKIMDTLKPAAVITDLAHKEAAEAFAGEAKVIVLEDVLALEVNEEDVKETLDRILDTDVLYVLFTSGSTGVPKGVTISHRALIDFIEWGAERFALDDMTVFGNQTPFYFSMSVFDIYQTLRNGATAHIIPQKMFSFPGILMQYLQEHKVNTLFWVPSALTLVAAFHCLNAPHVDSLKNIFFGGEVMPMKQLNAWIEEYPDAKYVNFYGPTEVTDTCTVYEVNRHFENTEKLPMGNACRNMDVFLLDEQDQLVTGQEIGEVCVRGCGLAYGYYNDPQKTKEVFVQNPLNKVYPEIIYRTGDLAQRNAFGEFVYISRKDFQIKHMGHRIELGEIEAAVSSIEGVEQNACIFDHEKSRIILFYSGNAQEKEVMEAIKNMLPVYMVPNKRVKLETMPFNLNGKIDRQKLKEIAKIK